MTKSITEYHFDREENCLDRIINITPTLRGNNIAG